MIDDDIQRAHGRVRERDERLVELERLFPCEIRVFSVQKSLLPIVKEAMRDEDGRGR